MTRQTVLLALCLITLPAVRLPAADEGGRKGPEMSREERLKRADLMDKMADAHKKMADCLRSEKPISECHEQMMKECPMAKEGHCPVMDEMKGWHGMHGKTKGMKGGEGQTKGNK